MKHCLVTGGAGFIGSHMVDLLADRGFRVHIIDNLAGGRVATLAHHKSNTHVVLDERDIRALAPDETAAFERHLDGCAACRARVATLRDQYTSKPYL